MTSLFEILDDEEALVRGKLSELREKVAAAEEQLVHLTITRRTLESLLSTTYFVDDVEPDPPHEAREAGDPPCDSATSSSGASHSAGDPASPSGRPLEWEVARERILVLLAGAGRSMKVQDISAAIGEDTSLARRVETTRSRLKRLAKEGRVIEGPIAWFAINPTGSESRPEGAAM
ncbi:hypothetical protein OG311_16385 [Streptomyces sp. NBC_01343]|uniref:hypothetical protein n=1 Tax=Streptomyces sp. NBC_01343 TaxID=2903832 RepID=UPI002E14D5D3|nr:hypothetical protein OG311_16385 [Streptomyces sp. NBC_01343]